MGKGLHSPPPPPTPPGPNLNLVRASAGRKENEPKTPFYLKYFVINWNAIHAYYSHM